MIILTKFGKFGKFGNVNVTLCQYKFVSKGGRIMGINKKKIEFLTLNIESEEVLLFEKLITSSDVVEQELKIKGKYVSLRILEKKPDTIIGLVETSKNENIPPKKNKKKKTIEKLGLIADEGLVYANIFIYEKMRKILMYEVNKSGCYIDHFLLYIYKCCDDTKSFKPFEIKLYPILNPDEYQRMLNMKFYKSVEFQVSHPNKIIDDYQHKGDALYNVCDSGASVGSTKVSAKFEVEANRNGSGLTSKSIRSLVDSLVRTCSGPKGESIKKIEVVGYETDSEDDKLIPIDLIADRYRGYIELNEPRENTDLLENQRVNQIKGLYEKCQEDFDVIFSKSK